MSSSDALSPRGIRARLRSARFQAAQARSFLGAVVADRLRPPPPPQVDGRITVEGLHGAVEIVRDRSGVPHCFAGDADDALFALGFVHGQDRFWQMEFYRRAAQGRMAEVTGPKGLPTDRLMRQLGMQRSADLTWETMSAELQGRFRPYMHGINAAFERTSPPLELRILDYEPEPWRAQDSVLWGKLLSFMLAPAWEIQILRARLVEAAGVEAVHAVDPGSPAAGPVIDPPGAPYGALTDELVSAYRGAVGEALLATPGLGSNNWAIAPERTDTGQALFACDPHLSAVFPSNGYFVHLDCPEFTAAGASVPGLPGIIWGHNRRIAWGPTASLASVQDLVLEEFEPDSDRYRTSEGWAEASVVEETIQVRGHPSETARVRITRHGPVVTPEIPGVRHALALRSPILGTATSGQGLLGLLTASNVDEFREAVAGFEDFNLAFGYADVDGHIGVQTSGLIPARPPGSAWLPLRGWEPESELGGGAGEGEGVCVPFERLPHTFDPPGGLVWSANNPPEPIEQLPFDGEFLDAYRAQRIGQGIEAVPHTFEAARALQVDRYSIPGARLQSHMATIEAQGGRERKLFAQVASWDGVMASDSVAAAVVSTTFSRLLDAVLRTKIGDAVEVYVGHVHAIPNLNVLTARGASLVLDLLDEAPPDWFGPAREGVSGREVWTAVLTRSFREGVDLLRSRLGRDPARWTWGRCHQLTLAHGLHDEPATARLFDVGPFEFAGDANTVFQAGPVAVDPFARVSAIPALRLIVDLTDPPRAEFALAGGQSERRGHPHRTDLLDDWMEGRTRPLRTERAVVEQEGRHRLVLEPASENGRVTPDS